MSSEFISLHVTLRDGGDDTYLGEHQFFCVPSVGDNVMMRVKTHPFPAMVIGVFHYPKSPVGEGPDSNPSVSILVKSEAGY